MGLDRLELFNFKSYPGHQVIGPFQSFSSVIGPNGAGKSNLMDAISFVLAVKSSTLRSAALKDLIYRTGSKNEDGAEDDEGDEDEGVTQAKKAWVKAVYVDSDDNEWIFQRQITTSGGSEYKLNGKTVPYKAYNEKLESFGILVKARNFLVFQGDVEAVAQQSPKDLSKLIDQISGSLEHKAAYETASEELEKAVEQSTYQHNRRRGVNSEIKQYREMKREVERWRELADDKDRAVIRHLLWKLYHINKSIGSAQTSIAEKNESLADLRTAEQEAEAVLKEAKSEVRSAQKAVGKQERAAKGKEKAIDDKRPEVDAIDSKITHMRKKLDKTELFRSATTKDLDKARAGYEQCDVELQSVREAQKAHEDALKEKAQEKGFAMTEEDLREYHQLKKQANKLALSERQALATATLAQKGRNDALNLANISLESIDRKTQKLEADESGLAERKKTVDDQVKTCFDSLQDARKRHNDLVTERSRILQTETEVGEKLNDCISKLQQAGADREDSRREAKARELLDSLKRTFPGVHGRVVNICRPAQRKYDAAIQTVLGRNLDSIVVDNEQTAISCIEYMRLQRAGQATFLPLDTIQVKPINDKFRSFARGARLAVDVLSYDPAVEKAIHFACGNALVCDTLDVAKHVSYEKGQEVKAVTLDGTVIHKSGNMTGGVQPNQQRRFEDRDVEGLRRLESELRARLQELHRSKPKPAEEETLIAQVRKFESDLELFKDDAAQLNVKLGGVQAELKTLRAKATEERQRTQQLAAALQKAENESAVHRAAIDAAEAGIFAAFCKRVNVANVREYEEQLLRGVQEDNETTIKLKTQIARLENKVSFEREQVETMENRIKGYDDAVRECERKIEELTEEKAAVSTELEQLAEGLATLQEALGKYQATLADHQTALDEAKQAHNKALRSIDKVIKDVATLNDDIQKLATDRHSIYRRCKLEEIELPLKRGSLEEVPMEEGMPQYAMDVDGDEAGTQRAAEVVDYGIKIDSALLASDEKEDDSDTMEKQLQEQVTELAAQLERMSPNVKAVDRLGDSEARFKQIHAEFESAREAAKAAKDKFEKVKKERCRLFNKAFNHISERIDNVYKGLTKGPAAPLGGVAYLSLEDADEPYLHGIKYHAMPPMKRFRDMDQLSGGEKTMAALALLFAIHTYQPAPFFVLDEVDSALDNTNVSRVARYIRKLARQGSQFITISLKTSFYENSHALVGIYRDSADQGGGSASLTLDLMNYANHLSSEAAGASQSQSQAVSASA